MDSYDNSTPIFNLGSSTIGNERNIIKGGDNETIKEKDSDISS